MRREDKPVVKPAPKGEITKDEYDKIKDGLACLKGGGLGRWGFYYRKDRAHTATKYKGQACYASLGSSWKQQPSHSDTILYVGFNPYGRRDKGGTSHYSPGAHEKDDKYAIRAEKAWLSMLLDPTGPFKNVLPFLYETNPSVVHEDGGFIFKPEAYANIPGCQYNVFLMCARLCHEYGPTADTYLRLRENKHTKRISALIATGIKPDDRKKKDTTWTAFQPSHTYVSGDVTNIAYRWMYARPAEKLDSPGGGQGSYGTEGVYKASNATHISVYNDKRFRKTFEDEAEVVKYFKQRAEEQRVALGEKK